MNTVPTVKWQAPDNKPVVKADEYELFWMATRSKNCHGEWNEPIVRLAQYVNKPLVYAEDHEEGDEPINSYLITVDGEPFEAIGWFDIKNHAEFDDYYEPIVFREGFELLGWAEYAPPEFKVSGLTLGEASKANG